MRELEEIFEYLVEELCTNHTKLSFSVERYCYRYLNITQFRLVDMFTACNTPGIRTQFSVPLVLQMVDKDHHCYICIWNGHRLPKCAKNYSLGSTK